MLPQYQVNRGHFSKTPGFCSTRTEKLQRSNVEYEIIVVDSTETAIERPKKKQRRFYSGKKKRHTIKTQVIMGKENKKIICTEFSNGRKHDFRMFKESKVRILPKMKVLADTGYRGLQKVHENVELPYRKMKKNPLTREQREENQRLLSKRAVVENVIEKIQNYSG